MSLLRLVLVTLVSVLAVGCLTQAGKSVTAVGSASASSVSSASPGSFSSGASARVCRAGAVRQDDGGRDSSVRADGSSVRADGAAPQGQCGKRAVAETSAIAPAAASTQVAPALYAADATGSSPPALGPGRCAPAAPPDVGHLCVLRI
ncbi:hypothetical protein [Actinomadura logoneensis]|uniref:hypothetical protein n=1 Tax=Actinomadura logoneensis TaxID=2293572 RepID=UPI00131498EC|nr:hypothetical protein [Actinomadura logoneensis]